MNTSTRRILNRSIATLVAATFGANVHAATWNADAGDNWSVASRWTGGLPNAVGAIADFSTINITAARTVTVDTTSRTVGTLIFGDATTLSHDWTLAASGGAQLTMNFDAGAIASVIQVLNRTATISVPLLGADGINVTGNGSGTSGTVVFNAANNFTGGLTITGAIAQLNNATAAGANTITVATSTNTASANRLQVNGGITIANNVVINAGASPLAGQGAINHAGTGQAVINGTITINGNTANGGHLVGGTAGNELVLGGAITSSVNVVQREGRVIYRGTGSSFTNLTSTGAVIIGANNALPTGAAVLITNTNGGSAGSLELGAFNQTIASLNIVGGSQGTVTTGAGVLTLNGSLTSANNFTHFVNGNINLNAGTRTFTVNDGTNPIDLQTGAAFTNGTINKAGAGTMTLNGTSTANVTVNAGAIGGTGSVGTLTVNAGTTLHPGTLTSSGTLTSGSLAFGAGATTLRMDAGPGGDLLNTGTLTTGGTTTVRLGQFGGILANGTYPLINYTGTSPGLGGFSLLPAMGHATATLTDTGTAISVDVSGNDRVIWDGTNSTAWTTAATGNWKLESTLAATDYIEGDDVIFQDGPTNGTVDIAADVAPSNVTFTNTTATDFTVNGPAGIVGSTRLTKSGNGAVTLASTNAFAGDVFLSGGLLQVAMGNAVTGNLGSTPNTATLSKTIFFTNNATLRNTTTFNNAVGTATNMQVVFNLGAGGGTLDVPSGLTLTIDDGSTAGNAQNAAQLQGTGTLTKIGDGTLSLGFGASNYSAFTGAIVVDAGTLQTGTTVSTAPFGSTSVGTTVNSGATVNTNGVSIGAEPLTLSGSGFGGVGALINSTGAGGAATGPITLAADTSIGGAGTTLTLSGRISGGFNLTKIGAVTLVLSNAVNSYGGATNIDAGQITASVVGSLPSTTDLVFGGGNLDPANLTHNVASIAGTSGSIIQGTAGTGVLRTTQSTATEFLGSLTRVKVDMSGSGALTLGGTADNITGTAEVNAGTLILAKTGDDNIHSLGAGGIGLIINSGGTVQIAGSTSGGGTGSNARPADAPANYSDQIFNLTDVVIRGGGVFDLNDHSEVIDALTGTGTITNTGTGTSRLYTNNGNTSSSFAGVIQDGNGTVELTKQGTGTFTLTGANTYTGVTNVAAGRLNINGASRQFHHHGE